MRPQSWAGCSSTDTANRFRQSKPQRLFAAGPPTLSLRWAAHPIDQEGFWRTPFGCRRAAARPGIKVCPERSNPPTHAIAATPAGRRQGWSRYPCCCSNSQVLDTVTRAGRSAPENRYQQRIQQHRPRCVLEGSRKILPRFTEMGTLVSQWCQ